MPKSVLALFLSTLAIGTTEFVIAGLLPRVAIDLDVTIPKAGFLVTAYALGVAVGGPLLALALARAPRKIVLLSLIILFTLGQAFCALAPTYGTLLLARVLVACSHGAYFGVAAVAAIRLVPPSQAGRAVAVLLAGITVANILGVPTGTAIGNALGWRATFWAVGLLGLAALAAMLALLPNDLGTRERTDRLASQLAVLRRPAVYLTFAIIILGMIGQFSLFTYIAPLFTTVAGFPDAVIPWLLLLFGLGSTLGVIIGGRLADWKLMPSLVGILIGQAVVYALVALSTGDRLVLGALILVWGAAAFAYAAPAQTRVLQWANDAPNLASTLIPTAFNIGIAAGAWLGSAALGGTGYASLPWIGCASALVALGIALWSWAGETNASRPVRGAA